jgi:serine/threonine protein kinase/Tfp pilus assembly protein PilF
MPSVSEKSVFLQALELESPAERKRYLLEVCAANPALRAGVEELLHAHEQPGNLLDNPPAGAFSAKNGLAVSGSQAVEHPGMTIGPYKLMEQIGEGGFGLVFVAEQQQPVRRKVALKVMKPGMDSREIMARFEAERQALALMEHPNIARVFDAGATPSGRPYFVMELVRGVPITEFCDQNRMSLRARLELFVHVCHAVQHAHLKGIIHRDLKPSNVLVTLHDGTPVVKVIDFGVAKAVGQQLTERTVYTRFTQMIGTPLYMSPEQAEMSGLDVDTRSDIYSLGVLLYELLTGATPFDRKRIQTASFDELRRIIREEEPPRPSQRFSTLGAARTTVSVSRGAEPGLLTSVLRGDLDWIVMKSLEKDRTRRYETAAEFSQDILRYLKDEEVVARPPTTLYRFGKLVRRNRVAFFTTSLVMAALITGTTVSAWQAVRATAALGEADRLRGEAEAFTRKLKEANVLLDSARANAEQERWAQADAQYTRAVNLQPEHYLAWSGRGSLYVRLGLWKKAADDYAEALDLGGPMNNPGWWGVPQLCLYAGDEASFRLAAQRTLAHLQQSPDSFFTTFAIRSCCVAASSPADAAHLARLAEQHLAKEFLTIEKGGPPYGPPGRGRFDREPPGRGPFPMPPDGRSRRGNAPKFAPRHPPQIQYYAAGLAHFRAGDYPRALERLQESMANDYWQGTALSYPVAAMAYFKLGKTDQANEMLTAADKAGDRWIRQMGEGPVGTMPIPWFDWMEFACLEREAQELIKGNVRRRASKLRELEKRALAALKQP